MQSTVEGLGGKRAKQAEINSESVSAKILPQRALFPHSLARYSWPPWPGPDLHFQTLLLSIPHPHTSRMGHPPSPEGPIGSQLPLKLSSWGLPIDTLRPTSTPLDRPCSLLPYYFPPLASFCLTYLTFSVTPL